MRSKFIAFLLLIFTGINFFPCLNARAGNTQKGMCYVTWDRDSFMSPSSDLSIRKMKDTGVTHVAIVVTLFQDTARSTGIYSTNRTPSDDSIRHAAEQARSLGLDIMLKPHVDILRSEGYPANRADIGFYNENNWIEWFKSYSEIILHYAAIADEIDAEVFCIGTELSFTAQKSSFWRKLIEKIRGRYKGDLVYAANWDNFESIDFWDALDYIGINAYFPLSDRYRTTVVEMARTWKKWEMKIERLYRKFGKPVIFTEIGYASYPYAPIRPWENGYTGKADTFLQDKCYTAFFKSLWGKGWLAGVYWWHWTTNVNSGGENNRRYTPQNKPAERTVRSYYMNTP
jgi:hypothetical protein